MRSKFVIEERYHYDYRRAKQHYTHASNLIDPHNVARAYLVAEDIDYKRQKRPPHHRANDDAKQQEGRFERRSLIADGSRRRKEHAKRQYGEGIGDGKPKTCRKVAQNFELGEGIVHLFVFLPLLHGVFAENIEPQSQHQYAANDADKNPVVDKKIGYERQTEPRNQGIEKVAKSRPDTHQEALPEALLYGFLYTQHGNSANRTRRQKANHDSSV